MYGLFTYIYHKNQPNVGKYTSPMDPSWDFQVPAVKLGGGGFSPTKIKAKNPYK